MEEFQIKRIIRYEIDGQEGESEIVIGPLHPEGNAWVCECHIPKVMAFPMKIYGEDALQALLLALEMCCASIKTFCRESNRVW